MQVLLAHGEKAAHARTLEIEGVSSPLAAQPEALLEVGRDALRRLARALHRKAVLAADVDVGHQRFAAPMSVSGSQVAISGKKERITIASIMHPT